jgi:hypothetical protein
MLRKLLNTFLCLGLPLFAAVPAVAADAPKSGPSPSTTWPAFSASAPRFVSPDGDWVFTP